MDIYTQTDILNGTARLKDFTDMRTTRFQAPLREYMVMGGLIMLTSASIITIMSVF